MFYWLFHFHKCLAVILGKDSKIHMRSRYLGGNKKICKS